MSSFLTKNRLFQTMESRTHTVQNSAGGGGGGGGMHFRKLGIIFYPEYDMDLSPNVIISSFFRPYPYKTFK